MPSGILPVPAVGPRWLPESVSRYGEAIEVAAAAHGVDPALVSLVVLVESRGNPNVQSPAGAVGLMQLMPATAAHIAAERGLPAPTLAQLREPAFNLDFGAYLLAQLLAPAAGTPSAEQVRLAAIGYNGGSKLLRDYLAGQGVLWRETERYSWLLNQLWTERDADSSATYRALGEQ
jgi:soluble lytic murein transglycosylase-like protein